VSVLGVTRRFFSLSPVFECPFSNYKPCCKEKCVHRVDRQSRMHDIAGRNKAAEQ
jgi:hypothetical protein